MARPKRPDPAHRDTDKIISEMEKRIAAEYRQAHEEVTAKLNDYLARYRKKDEIWRQWVKDGKKTKEEYQRWVKGQVLMGRRWDEMKDALAKDYLNAHKIAESIVNGYMPEVYALNHNYTTFAIEQGSMLDTSYTLYSRETVERLLRDDPELYGRPGKKVSEAIRNGELMAWDKRQIQSVMIQGILQGESIPNLTKRLEKVTGGEHKAAIRNARTMATGVENAGRIDAMKRANNMGIPTRKQWLATLDQRTRHWHRQLDGVIVDIDKPFENEFGKIMYPGDPKAKGSNIYNCRCTLLYAIKGHEIDVKNRNLRHDKNLGKMTYDEWKASRKSISHPITKQEDIAERMKRLYYGGAGGGTGGTGGGLASAGGNNSVEPHDPPEYLGKILDDTDRQSVLSYYEDFIVDSPIENAIVITKNGDIYWCKGTLNGVWPENDLGDKIRGADVTHNHPDGSNNEYSFSSGDIILFSDYDLNTLRGVDRLYKYRLTRNKDDIDHPGYILDINEYSARHESVILEAAKKGYGYRRIRNG